MTNSCDTPFILPGLVITEAVMTQADLLISAQSSQESAQCPKCGAISHQHHSSYKRQVQDTPVALLNVCLQIRVRRFRCNNRSCRQQTFAEQFPDIVDRRRQRTQRLINNLTQIGLALGGKAGAGLAGKLSMTASASTLLRLLHQMELPLSEDPRIIGFDDWAFRKGRMYGTLIIDHEKGKPIDLLPERDCETVRQWLKRHPTVEFVTRDRSGEYREAITQALPDAVPKLLTAGISSRIYEKLSNAISQDIIKWCANWLPKQLRKLLSKLEKMSELKIAAMHLDRHGKCCMRPEPRRGKPCLLLSRSAINEVFTPQILLDNLVSRAKRSVDGSIAKPYHQTQEAASSKNA